jgi:hypothetical protein
MVAPRRGPAQSGGLHRPVCDRDLLPLDCQFDPLGTSAELPPDRSDVGAERVEEVVAVHSAHWSSINGQKITIAPLEPPAPTIGIALAATS